MEEYIYGIYDLKALRLLSGMMLIQPSDAAATRWFVDILSVQGTTQNSHPEDFVLVRLGTIEMDGLAMKSYSVGATDPVTTGAAIVRYYASQTTPDQQTLPKEDASSDSNLVADLSLVPETANV